MAYSFFHSGTFQGILITATSVSFQWYLSQHIFCQMKKIAHKYMKIMQFFKLHYFIFSLFIIPLLFLLPLFKSGMYVSHDGNGQIVRIGAYYNAIRDGQIPVRWNANINYTYGSPLFIFYYPLPYYIGSFFLVFCF